MVSLEAALRAEGMANELVIGAPAAAHIRPRLQRKYKLSVVPIHIG